MQSKKLPVIFLLGPTASGKTDWAIEWQKQFECIEIISVDSVMIYRGCDIGSAKPTAEILKKHPHHLVNFTTLDKTFSVANFCIEALQCIEGIHQRNNIPLLVGGSMMYFNLLKNGITALPSADSNFREALDSRIKSEGLNSLYTELSTLDAIAASKIMPQDTQRIIRALELIYLASSVELTDTKDSSSDPLSNKYNLHEYGIFPKDRALLHKRIEVRQRELIAGGLLEEVKGLQAEYQLSPDHPAMKAVNYRQALQVINEELEANDLFERSLYATRQLAKRQCTWLRGWENLHAFDIDEFNQATKHLKNALNFA